MFFKLQVHFISYSFTYFMVKYIGGKMFWIFVLKNFCLDPLTLLLIMLLVCFSSVWGCGFFCLFVFLSQHTQSSSELPIESSSPCLLRDSPQVLRSPTTELFIFHMSSCLHMILSAASLSLNTLSFFLHANLRPLLIVSHAFMASFFCFHHFFTLFLQFCCVMSLVDC